MFALRNPRVPPSIVVRRSWSHAVPGVLVALVVIIVVANLFRAASSAPPPMPLAPGAVNDWHQYHDRDYVVREVTGPTSILVSEPDVHGRTLAVSLLGVAPAVENGIAPDTGGEAGTFLSDLVEGGTVHLALSPRQTRDDAGRLLAYVFLERGGRMVNEMMLEGGWARVDRNTPHPYQEQFDWLERRAVKDGLGLWAIDAR